MYILDKEKARKVLMENKLTPFQVDNLLKYYPPLPDKMGIYVEQWLIDQIIPEIVIEGISLRDVMQKRRSHFLVALRELGRLLDPNLTPEKRKLWREILTTPVFYE